MDKDAIVDLLELHEAGIIGEEQDGSFRVAFGRQCEMVDSLVRNLYELNLDIQFVTNDASSLSMNITPLQKNPKQMKDSLLSDFKLLPNKMGIYTFRKTDMTGVVLRQLCFQIEPMYKAVMLEDDPGTESFFLHVELEERASNYASSQNDIGDGGKTHSEKEKNNSEKEKYISEEERNNSEEENNSTEKEKFKIAEEKNNFYGTNLFFAASVLICAVGFTLFMHAESFKDFSWVWGSKML